MFQGALILNIPQIWTDHNIHSPAARKSFFPQLAILVNTTIHTLAQIQNMKNTIESTYIPENELVIETYCLYCFTILTPDLADFP